MTALDALLGRPGELPICKEIGSAAVHWFVSDPTKTATCRCGKRERLPDGTEREAHQAITPAPEGEAA